MPESPPRLTILQLTHQGEGAGSTQSIFSLSRALAERGHRILVGCPPGTLLARHVAATPTLEHVPLDFSRLRTVAATIAGVIATKRVDVVNSHATGDRRACTWLRWRGRLPGAFVVTRRTMPLTLPPALIAVGLTMATVGSRRFQCVLSTRFVTSATSLLSKPCATRSAALYPLNSQFNNSSARA